MLTRRGREVGIDVVLDLDQQRWQLVVERVVEAGQDDLVDDGRALRTQRRDGRVGDGVDVGYVTPAAPDADALALQSTRVEVVEVVPAHERRGCTGRRIGRVDAL